MPARLSARRSPLLPLGRRGRGSARGPVATARRPRRRRSWSPSRAGRQEDGRGRGAPGQACPCSPAWPRTTSGEAPPSVRRVEPGEQARARSRGARAGRAPRGAGRRRRGARRPLGGVARRPGGRRARTRRSPRPCRRPRTRCRRALKPPPLTRDAGAPGARRRGGLVRRGPAAHLPGRRGRPPRSGARDRPPRAPRRRKRPVGAPAGARPDGPAARLRRGRARRARALVADLDAWIRPALGTCDALRACFHRSCPRATADFVLRFLPQATDDPGLLRVPAADVWKTQGRTLKALGRAFSGRRGGSSSARSEPPRRGSRADRPGPRRGRGRSSVDPQRPRRRGAFLAQAAAGAGRGRGSGRGRAGRAPGLGAAPPAPSHARRRGVTAPPASSRAAPGSGSTRRSISRGRRRSAARRSPRAEHHRPRAAKSPLVRHRGAWVVVVPEELAEIARRLGPTPAAASRRARRWRARSLARPRVDGMAVPVIAEGALTRAMEQLRSGAERAAAPPRGVRGDAAPVPGARRRHNAERWRASAWAPAWPTTWAW